MTKQLMIATATVTVFAWSVVMVAFGQTAAIATLAPALGLTVHQIVLVTRSHGAPAPGQPEAAVGDKEGGAP
ncbi:hypothetical protein QQY66_34035 [Streptomyces sp. DG2A-72]|uniref:hypothetical protein n=1 Tax=Streptomyces sp. DG2A-72 TaxID=3051386 RepID=UPI00265B747A|nr:hypothetical protein [Streptomyces sp. DG2A-72]MDO0936480.1 hypothetical protein [Streptomyces sp. DG2A-72]